MFQAKEGSNEQTARMKQPFWTTRRITRLAVMIALSWAGSLLKIPSPTGTVALDSATGYYAGVKFGPAEGGIVAGIGHLFTAAMTGFPLGLPIHLFVAVQQAAWAMIFWLLSTKVNLWVGIIGGIVCNGILGPLMMIPIIGTGFAISMIIPLLVGSTANIVVAALAYKKLKKVR